MPKDQTEEKMCEHVPAIAGGELYCRTCGVKYVVSIPTEQKCKGCLNCAVGNSCSSPKLRDPEEVEKIMKPLKDYAEAASASSTLGWEKEFREKFLRQQGTLYETWKGEWEEVSIEPKEVIDFIKDLLSKKDAEIRSKIVKEIRSKIRQIAPPTDPNNYAYNRRFIKVEAANEAFVTATKIVEEAKLDQTT